MPVYELDKKLTRLEALTLVIRLMGLEKEAMDYTGANPFTDITAWGDRYAAYAYHLGIAFGINKEHTLFAPDREVTFQEFTAFLLRVLDYSEANGDFEYITAIQKAASAGLFKLNDVTKLSADNFLRSYAVLEMANALVTEVKGSDTILLYKLRDKGVIAEDDADWFMANFN